MNPRYPEIAADVIKRIEKGEWKDNFPTSRDLVKEYKASNRTIAKVWDKLKSDGIIYTRPGKGTYIKKRSN